MKRRAMNKAFDEYKRNILYLLRQISDANYENLDGESRVIDNKLRLKLNSIRDKVKSL